MSIFDKIKDFFLGKKKKEKKVRKRRPSKYGHREVGKYGRPTKPVRRKKRATRKPKAVKSYYYKK